MRRVEILAIARAIKMVEDRIDYDNMIMVLEIEFPELDLNEIIIVLEKAIELANN